MPDPKKGAAKKKQRGPIEELIRTFVVQDLGSVNKKVMKYRIIPDMQRLIANAAKDGIDMLFGMDVPYEREGFNRSSLDDWRRRNERSNGNSSNAISGNRNSLTGGSKRFDSRDYTFDNIGEAEAVLEKLRNEIYEMGKASVASFLSEAGHTPIWTDYDIGWTNLDEDRAFTRRSSDGYCIVAPPPIRISSI